MRPCPALVLALGASLAAGCASTPHNYLDPEGPVHGGHFGVAPAAKPEIRVVTFNIEFGTNVEPAIEALRSHPQLREPDVLLLQEMDREGVEEVATALKLDYAYCPSSVNPRTRRDLGTAVLSPWPIEDRWKVRLPHLSRLSHHARSVVGACVAIDGQRVRVYSVHFGTLLGLSGRQRREQLQALVDDARGSPDPVIVGATSTAGAWRVFSPDRDSPGSPGRSGRRGRAFDSTTSSCGASHRSLFPGRGWPVRSRASPTTTPPG